jgi:hypothetical protein
MQEHPLQEGGQLTAALAEPCFEEADAALPYFGHELVRHAFA